MVVTGQAGSWAIKPSRMGMEAPSQCIHLFSSGGERHFHMGVQLVVDLAASEHTT